MTSSLNCKEERKIDVKKREKACDVLEPEQRFWMKTREMVPVEKKWRLEESMFLCREPGGLSKDRDWMRQRGREISKTPAKGFQNDS